MAIYRFLGAATALAMITTPAIAQQVMGRTRLLRVFLSKRQLPEQGPGQSYTGDAWVRLNSGGPHGGTALNRTAS